MEKRYSCNKCPFSSDHLNVAGDPYACCKCKHGTYVDMMAEYAAELEGIEAAVGGNLCAPKGATTLEFVVAYVAGVEYIIEQSRKKSELLRKLQWSAGLCQDRYCPSCYNDEDKGHLPNCELVYLMLMKDDEEDICQSK